MIISYLKRHEVATISYPLMDPNIQLSGSTDYLDLSHYLPKKKLLRFTYIYPSVRIYVSFAYTKDKYLTKRGRMYENMLMP